VISLVVALIAHQSVAQSGSGSGSGAAPPSAPGSPKETSAQSRAPSIAQKPADSPSAVAKDRASATAKTTTAAAPSTDTSSGAGAKTTSPARPPSATATAATSKPNANASAGANSGSNASTTVAAPSSAGSATTSAVTTPKPKQTTGSSQSSKPKAKANSAATNAKTGKAARNNAQKSSQAPEPRKIGQESTTDSTETDPELVALGQAERALFPWALRGVRSSFSFDEALFGPLREPGAVAPAWLKVLSLPAVFPNVDGRIITYLEFYRSTPEGKSLLRTWAKKRGRYQTSITGTLAKAGVPTELVWQSLVESGHNPTIRSPAGAAGLWQFMPETARLYGLVVDRWLDERLDPERSTVAAAKMMGDLFQHFGNWELALAAFNMGEAGLLRAIRKYNTNDFWTLSYYEAGLPMETALYVPRIIALTIAMQNAKAFGIDDIVPDDPIEFDTVTLAPGQLLSTVARVIGVTEGDVVQKNPHWLAQRVAPSVSSDRSLGRVYLPKGTADLLRARAARLTGLEADLVAYAVKAGDSFELLASARGISVDTLRNINRAPTDERIEPGALVLLPRQSAEPIESKSADEERIAVVPPYLELPKDQRRIFYRVRAGDTISSIADAFAVRRLDLVTYNSLDTSAKLQPRMLLQLCVPVDAPLDARSFLDEKDVTILIAGSTEFSEYFEGLRGNERVVVQAKEKDTLATIGARFGVTVGMMERINRRSRRDVLSPGEAIVVYTKRKGNQSRIAAAH